MLSPEAIQFLRELQGRREFIEILKEIESNSPPLYRPLRSVESSVLPVDVQESNWKFESGRIRECERIVKLLTLGE